MASVENSSSVSVSRYRTQIDPIDEAKSSFHRRIHALLREDPILHNLVAFQEVLVSDLVSGYPYTNHRVDWYIRDLNLVLELHGQQHYRIVNFGSEPEDVARKNFYGGLFRDELKRTAIAEAGYRYIALPFKMVSKLSCKELRNILLTGSEYEFSRRHST